MTVMDFILEYIEDRGVSYANKEEYDETVSGIKVYLNNAGIHPEETRTYFFDFVSRHLKKVDGKDLKDYFLCYPIISFVNQVLIENRNGHTANNRKLAEALAEIRRSPIGDKYLPMDEVRQILG